MFTTFDAQLLYLHVTDFLSGCDGDFMKKLEDELSSVDGDTGLLSVDTKVKLESPRQVSPYYSAGGNPLVSQYTNVSKPSHLPQPKTSPVQGVYGREESYNLQLKNNGAPLPDVTQHGQKHPPQTPMILQQVVQSPLYVNLGPGTLQQVPDSRAPLVQLEGVTQLNQVNKNQPNQPVLIQNNPKGSFILKSTDSSFSSVILQSSIISPETQTLMYTSAPVQGELICKCINALDLFYVGVTCMMQSYC